MANLTDVPNDVQNRNQLAKFVGWARSLTLSCHLKRFKFNVALIIPKVRTVSVQD